MYCEVPHKTGRTILYLREGERQWWVKYSGVVGGAGNDCRARLLCCDREKGDVMGRVGTVFDGDRENR